MFSLAKKKVSPRDILSSGLFNERDFYARFEKDLRHCKQEVIIESPYMTVRRASQLTPILKKLVKRGVRVTIHTRFPNHHDQLLRIQAWQAAKILKEHGIKVRYFNNYLHRKTAILDNRILWEGSLNILSQNNSQEIMRRIESEELTRQMVRFLGLKRFYW